MLTYLKDRQYYEDLYDESTVRQCRSAERIVNSAFCKMEAELPSSEFKERLTAWYVEYSKFYFQLVELLAVSRHYKREEAIAKWMEHDEQKDRRLASARLSQTPYCRKCGGDVEFWDKYYMRRDRDARKEENDILFIFACEPCKKRLMFWEDGTEWEGVKTYCEKCSSEMNVIHKESADALTSTYVCTTCKHNYTETLDLNSKPAEEEPADPFYELDRKRFCLDSETIQKLEDKLEHMGRLAKLYADASERTEHADVYDTIKEIKQLKIAQLIETLRPGIEKAGYSELKLGEPQISQRVTIEFNCLDNKSEREEYNSKNDLKKLIAKTLEDTNWRLMKDGLTYRLGYLRGWLRAYEGEAELKKLAEQRLKSNAAKKPTADRPLLTERYDPERLNKVEAIKIYSAGEKLTINSTPIENGTKRPDKRLTVRGILHPKLRVIIPARENDDAVPQFVRNFDFKMASSKVFKKDSPKTARKK